MENKANQIGTAGEQLMIEGRNPVLEAFRSGKTIDKIFVLDGCQDGPIRTIVREAKKHDTVLNFVGRERLNQILADNTGKPLDVIAQDTERDNYMSADEAKAYGLIDEIMERH